MSMPNRKWLLWLAAPALALTLGLSLVNPTAAQEEEDDATVPVDISGLVQSIIVDASGGDATAAVNVEIEGDATATAAASATGGAGGTVEINVAGFVGFEPEEPDEEEPEGGEEGVVTE
jgi:hypothetical protein